MKLVRYELYADDEKQDVGIFQWLCEVFNGKTADKLCEPLDMNFPASCLERFRIGKRGEFVRRIQRQCHASVYYVVAKRNEL